MIPRALILSLACSAAVAGSEHVLINEIHFQPKDNPSLEFVELHNAGDAPATLDGWRLDKFTFPAATTLSAGGYLVLAANPDALEKEYGVKAAGTLQGRLSNEGEKLTLFDASGRIIDEVRYGVGFPWPTASAGNGSSLERIHPMADASKPGHWRASGFPDAPARGAEPLIPPGSDGWRWRRGDAEQANWTAPGFDDSAWSTGKAGFGYGDDDDATVIGDMQGRFPCVYLRRSFTVERLPAALAVRVRVDDGCIVWLNGREVARLHVGAGKPTARSFAESHEAGEWEEVEIPDPSGLVKQGANTIAVQGFNASVDSSDFSLDVSLGPPLGGGRGGKAPTPGARNSVTLAGVPPACEWVRHEPQQPRSGGSLVFSAALTDAGGIRSAVLHAQFVEPGAYVRRSDPEYETRWRDFPMNDDGRDGDATARDHVWSVLLPPAELTNRRLIRYRITATGADGAAVRLPYSDDPSPNFACFVWDGPPAWTGASQPGKTPQITFSTEMQKTLPIFTLIANAGDVQKSQYDGGANHRRFKGTFVHGGEVIDHMEFHNRGSASTYVAGKNKWGFKFPDMHELSTLDQWGNARRTRWNSFSMNACASPWVQVNRGMAGMDEAVSFRAYQLAGVPASDCQPVHFRVVTSSAEQGATQYDGDLWGLYTAIEDTDGPWLKNHGLPDGITVNPERGVRHVPSGFKGDPGGLWNEFASGPRGDAEQWWRGHMDLPTYYSFHAVNRLVSNIDLRPGANHHFYRHPARGWMPVPWDLDMQFIPCSHQPGYIGQAACLDVPALRTEFRNRAREILDLLASDPHPDGGQIGQLVAEYARLIEPSAGSWAQLDQCRWNYAPPTSDKGAFFRNPASQGMMGGSFSRTLSTPDFSGFSKYVVDFCTDSRPVKNYAVNDHNPLGYGWGYLAIEAADKEIPARPVIRSVGPPEFTDGALAFEASEFADPQGANTFEVMQWRVGEIGRPKSGRWRYEIEPVWQSAESPAFVPQVHIPQGVCKPGHTYRTRVRFMDKTKRWSHWSEPVQFTVR